MIELRRLGLRGSTGAVGPKREGGHVDKEGRQHGSLRPNACMGPTMALLLTPYNKDSVTPKPVTQEVAEAHALLTSGELALKNTLFFIHGPSTTIMLSLEKSRETPNASGLG
ncbi:hypothetical protein CKAN_02701800 [Cinnamomum micranthum f. kanehirae]|uniref:Uncharacterized protein n=1 Tax=Cinnamomum micranthum f. kanehirae TaxID=337451 RepID=A0A443Q3I6_9MAGN|nr:hypothetical protein CKAN_02701800 [Cinnamomum micranthum f. kanehirae]